MKKLTAILLSVALILTATACNENNTEAEEFPLISQPPAAQTEITTTARENNLIVDMEMAGQWIPTYIELTQIEIGSVKDGRIKEEIISELKNVQLLNENERQINSVLRLWDIKDFYVPTVEIDGFEMDNVLILGGTFSYKYTPNDYSDCNYKFNFDTGMKISITRKDYYEFYNKKYPETIEQFDENLNLGHKIFDGDLFFIESDIYNLTGGVIDDTWFYLTTPKSIDLDSALQIGRDLINTAELVNVQHELDVLRQQSE
jgi:hypothetical protein